MLRKATRKKAKMRLGISGPSGSGKTYTSLLIASGITTFDKVAVIDSENGSADLYSHLGDYQVYPLSAPYTPQSYIEAIRQCELAGMEVIIIDSITHEWNGKGGCLDMHEAVVAKMKISNSFTAWAEITPLHQAFIDSILQSPCHIITTVRSKTEYVMTEKNGKQVPQKMGMAAVTRDGFEYELTLSLDMDVNHKAHTSKDRTGLFIDKPAFVPSKTTGEMILDWCESGLDPRDEINESIVKLANCNTVDELKDLKAMLPEYVRKDKRFIDAATDRFNLITMPAVVPGSGIMEEAAVSLNGVGKGKVA